MGEKQMERGTTLAKMNPKDRMPRRYRQGTESLRRVEAEG